MGTEMLAAALEREHHEIDEGIEAFTASGGQDAAPLKRALDALRRHIYLEEEFLFPPLRDAGLMAPIFVMLREHGEIWRTMDRLEDEAGGDAGPATARELLAVLERHNSKEEPIIYPQADAVLPPEAADHLHRFIASGRTPEGWVCQGAKA
ncbi:hemerythrin domain-containing protein [Actinomadura latina]|uniref:Hemerythrin domain-containing protein n=1 Tax=Actinomadura latina TaxID=163603 RepID=A0A846Z3I5_9ACTN|nr:hemerythrin domain-containing protein [Actinomadura latina]NKZ05255.1 hemerythrin domain-containing protein [Actinomadura latina]